MRLEDYQKIVQDDVGGLYHKGDNDNVPPDHFSDCLNIDYEISEWGTRSGLSSSIIAQFGGNIKRYFFFNDVGIIIILDTAGNFYTYSSRNGDNAKTPFMTIIGANDFKAIKLLGKIFITTTSDGVQGQFAAHLKVYIPDPVNPANDVVRDAAGLAPTSATIVAANGAAGRVNAGTYQIAVSFITSTGFITPPGPLNTGVFSPTSYTAPGGDKINLSAIPTGPAGTVGRQILITKAGLTGYFFLASANGGVINDNTSTVATLDFDDTVELINSADYLFNLFQQIPAPLVMCAYNGKLILAGEQGNNSILRVSRVGDVESFDQVNGIYFVNKDDGFIIQNLSKIRGTLYIWKNLGVWYTTDNGGNATTWPQAQSLDENVNTGLHAIGEFYSAQDNKIARDFSVIADRSGLLYFDGVLRKSQLTNKISKTWKNINFLFFAKIVVIVDDDKHKIYAAVPMGFNATEVNTLLVGDYSLCPGKIPESTKIRWSIWQFNVCGSPLTPSAIGMFNYPPDVIPTLKVSGVANSNTKIYTLDPNVGSDDGGEIETMFESALLYWEPGQVHQFAAARLRAIGEGKINCSVRGAGNTNFQNLPSITLPGTYNWKWYLETPHGVIDGVNTQFTVCFGNSFLFSPVIPLVFQNGLIISPTLFTVSNPNTIIFNTAPSIGDTIQVMYRIGVPSIPTSTIDINTFFETPNTVNAIFHFLSNIPVSNWPNVTVFQNGLAVRQAHEYNISSDISGNTIATFVNAPATGDILYYISQVDTTELAMFTQDFSNLTNGVQTTFILSQLPNRDFLAVWLNGLLLRRYFDYQVNGLNLVFGIAPSLNDTLYVMYRPLATLDDDGTSKLIRFNYQADKAKIKFDLSSGKMQVPLIEYYGVPTYPMRPA